MANPKVNYTQQIDSAFVFTFWETYLYRILNLMIELLVRFYFYITLLVLQSNQLHHLMLPILV